MLNAIVVPNPVLVKLYQGKCDQLAHAPLDSLRYFILKLEAEALLAEINAIR